jgi:magnesium-transporting ATPase (P-type)
MMKINLFTFNKMPIFDSPALRHFVMLIVFYLIIIGPMTAVVAKSLLEKTTKYNRVFPQVIVAFFILFTLAIVSLYILEAVKISNDEEIEDYENINKARTIMSVILLGLSIVIMCISLRTCSIDKEHISLIFSLLFTITINAISLYSVIVSNKEIFDEEN